MQKRVGRVCNPSKRSGPGNGLQTRPTCLRFRETTVGRITLLCVAAVSLAWNAPAATLEVGAGKTFARVEDANSQAQPGDVILVHALPNGQPYEKTAVLVRQRNLTFRGVPAPDSPWVKLSGKGGDQSGRRGHPRAIFQFNDTASHGVLEGFELFGAHNDSHNGSGVRINQASHVTIRNCSIHDNDMGVMSNGDSTTTTAVNQRIEHCVIHHNGDPADPGYNHNLYLGGTSVTVRFCEIHSSLTGHNVKSRAHFNRVEYCYVHDSANREFDLVDSADTARPGSHAVLLGNIIVKDPRCRGNRGVIHFGQDGKGEHDGTLYLWFNTIITPFPSPVCDLSAPSAHARWVGNLFYAAANQSNQQLAAARASASLRNLSGRHNWFSGQFAGLGGTSLAVQENVFQRLDNQLFADQIKHDYRLTAEVAAKLAVNITPDDLVLPATPGATAGTTERILAWQYRHPASQAPRSLEKITVGATTP